MRTGKWIGSFAVLAALLTATVSAPAFTQNSYPTNPLGFFFNNTFQNVNAFKHPTGMLIAGRCNRANAHFAQARAAGGEVLAYLNVVEQPNSTPCATDTNFYTGGTGVNPARWLNSQNGSVRVNYANNEMLNLSASSAWADRVVAYVEILMLDDTVDGVFLDVVGARLWSTLANWNSWPAAERQAWTAGSVDLVRRLDERRRALNPRFIIVNNNTWDLGGLPAEGTAGEQYVDGVCLEHHDITAFSSAYAGRAFGNGKHRRVLIIADDDASSTSWANVQGVTHVASQSSADGYGSPPRTPVIGLNPLVDRQILFGNVSAAGATPSDGMTADRKRATRFTLAERGRLRELSAYLDGAGGASGQQLIRLVVYADSSGSPGAKVAESNARNLAAGLAASWYSFTLPANNQVLLNPGDYWIAILTGGTPQVLRNHGDTGANWFGNDDTYSDGGANPFGTGTTGSVTLAVRAGYTRE